MAVLRLTDRDIERLQHAQQILLSPLESADSTEWHLRANRAVRAFVGADHAVFMHADGPDPAVGRITSEDTDPSFAERLNALVTGFADGQLRTTDPLLDRAHGERSRGGSGAYHLEMFAPMPEWERSPSYREVFAPAGLRDMMGLSTPGAAGGEITQCLGFEKPGAEGCGEAGLRRLQLLVPAFAAGVRIHQAMRARRAALMAMLDRVPQAAAAYGTGGTLLYRSREMREMLAREPEAEALRAVADALARSLSARWARKRKAADRLVPRDTERRIRTAGGEYRLTASYLGVDLLGTEGVLVLAQRLGPVLPSATELCARSGLTPRQAEVALLMAEGLTDAAIAERLFLSPHTTRRYSERILKRLGLHSRAAVALALLRAGTAEQTEIEGPTRN